MNESLAKYLSSKKEIIETRLKSYFSSRNVAPRLAESMGYSLFSECKRFRPVLAIAACEALGKKEESVLPFACALELVHTYSLIHDDLPSMDDDDLRRGKATNHKVFGEAMAILSGDALLTMAFEIASEPNEFVSPKAQLEIINLLSRASGEGGMVGGQALDIENSNKKIGLRELEKIHLHKTGKLIQCATEIGAKAAGASEKQYSSLRNYGENVGFAFQITDDLLDYTGKVPGKNPKGDLKNNKATFATVLSGEKAKTILAGTIDKALASIAGFDKRADTLRNLADFIKSRIA